MVRKGGPLLENGSSSGNSFDVYYRHQSHDLRREVSFRSHQHMDGNDAIEYGDHSEEM